VGGNIQGILKGVNLMSARGSPLGISNTTLAAYSSAFQSLNLQVGQSSNAFDKLVTKLSAPETLSERATDGLAKMGLTSRDVADAMKKDAEGGLRIFLGRLNELAKTDTQSALEAVSMFIGEEYGSEIFALALGIDNLDKALGVAGDSTKAFAKYQDELNKKQQSVSGQLAISKAYLQSIGISLGLAILPSLNNILKTISPVVARFADFAAEHPRIVTIGVAIAGVVATIGPLIWVTGTLISSWGAITTAWGVASGVLGTTLIPQIGTLVSGIMTGAVPAISTFIAGVSSIALPFILAGAAIGIWVANIQAYAANWSDVLLGIKQTAINVIDWISDYFSTSGENAGRGLARALANGMFGGIPLAVEAASALAKSVRDYLPFSPAKTGALSDIDKSGIGLISTLVSGVQSAAPVLTNAVNSALGGAGAAISGAAAGAAAGAGGGQVIVNFTVNMDGRGGDGKGILENLRPFAREIGEMVEDALNKNRRGRY